MYSHRDIEVITGCVGELVAELNYCHAAKINGRKLESHGYIVLEGRVRKHDEIEIKIMVKDFDDGALPLEETMAGLKRSK